MDFFLTCCSILAEGLIFKAASASLLLCVNYLSLSPFFEEVEDITIPNIEERNMKESQTEFCSDCVWLVVWYKLH